MNSFYERRRRAASPPTWTCYERIQYTSDSCSSSSCSSDEDDEDEAYEGAEIDMDVDADSKEAKEEDVKGKGKQKEQLVRKRQSKRAGRTGYTLQPILTIQRSQGFVWNQDLFVPPYIKDRYVVSTSPPAGGHISSSASSANSTLSNEYENGIEVVEIRIQEGELDHVFA